MQDRELGPTKSPNDSVKNRTFAELFNGTVRYEIPFFQRGYAWEKRQWDQLFLDIQEQIVDELSRNVTTENVEHFFGPIVVLEKAGGVMELKNFLVIDGQQRLTTVYLLLGVIRAELEMKQSSSDEASSYSVELKKYLVNDVPAHDEYLKLKVFSSKGDRLPTFYVVFGGNTNPTTPFLQTDLQLYLPGKNRVDEFKKYAERKIRTICKDVPALWTLAQALLRCLKIVWIPLSEGKDDPQAIFESLNDKGMPLTASELLCSFIFRPIISNDPQYESLHNSKWLATIRLLQGNDIFEDYLRNLFSIGEMKMVGKGRKIYVHFKMKHKSLAANVATDQLEEIRASAPFYLNIRNPQANRHSDEVLTKTLIAIQNTRMESSTSFVLSILRALHRKTITLQNAREILHEVLVLLVRRKVTELPTTQYDTMFPQLLSKIEHEPNMVKALHEQFRKHAVWTSDQEFQAALISRSIYRPRDLAFSRMILAEIDKSFQKHGQLPDYTTVNTIEHILPQSLNDPWRNYLGVDCDDDRLAAVTDSIGNLCLLSGPANSSAGQNPFFAKKQGYSPVTALARQIKDHPGPWNIDAIMKRSKALAVRATEIWSWSI